MVGRKLTLIAVLLVLTMQLVLATPGIPHQFYGSVTINGVSATSGTVTAKINNVLVESGSVSGGKYGYSPNLFLIEDPESSFLGKTITFYVNNVEAATFIFSNGENTKLDLSITVAPFCGDGSCNSGETCSNCQGDCGTCSSGGGSSGGGGGGGGGGGSSGGSPLGSSPNTNNPVTTPNQESENKGIVKLNETKENPPFFSWLTGAVIGGGTLKYLIPLAFLVLIGIVYFLVVMKKKK